jgi:hypothetical protein
MVMEVPSLGPSLAHGGPKLEPIMVMDVPSLGPSLAHGGPKLMVMEVSRYVAVSLDEFADLSPKIVEANRLVGKLVHDRHLWKDFRVTCVWNSIWIMHI